jgi:hypothetical protein
MTIQIHVHVCEHILRNTYIQNGYICIMTETANSKPPSINKGIAEFCDIYNPFE